MSRTQIKKLMDFIDKSPSPFHAVSSSIEILESKGFKELKEKEVWSLESGGSYYVERSSSSLIAFCLPINKLNNTSFNIVGAHTDSPCFKLKPHASASVGNYFQWGAELYGGVLINSWLDRDLSLSGRITLIDGQHLKSHFIHLKDVKFRIPQLAIHLDRGVNDGLKLNKQQHLMPVLGLDKNQDLLQILLDQNGISAKTADVGGFDLYLHDSQASSLGGLNEEFIYAPRLDNLAMCHASLQALVLEKPMSVISMAALFDHEEVGSTSAQGACSNFLPAVLERISLALGLSRDESLASLRASKMFSADMAHAVHPNYSERHDPDHHPLINQGPVIKINANQRYATDSETGAYFAMLCKAAKVNVQNFVSRNDCPCGSTIGPSVANNLGIPTVDVGNPLLSMHSIREMAGSEDHGDMIKVFKGFYSK